MNFFDTKHKRKSIRTTTAILISMLLLCYNMGMNYYDPPIEYGVSIRTDIELETMNSIANENNNIQAKQLIESVKVSTKKHADQISNTVAGIKEEKKKVVNIEGATKIRKDKSQEIKSEPINQAAQALNGLLSSNSETSRPDSQDEKVKTDDNKTKQVDAKYLVKESGNFQLSGRKALFKGKQKPDCEKEGVIVVKVVVNNQGNVVQARGIGIQCLRKAAETAAKKTKWNPDPRAPKNQKGKIIYRFTLN